MEERIPNLTEATITGNKCEHVKEVVKKMIEQKIKLYRQLTEDALALSSYPREAANAARYYGSFIKDLKEICDKVERYKIID